MDSSVDLIPQTKQQVHQVFNKLISHAIDHLRSAEKSIGDSAKAYCMQHGAESEEVVQAIQAYFDDHKYQLLSGIDTLRTVLMDTLDNIPSAASHETANDVEPEEEEQEVLAEIEQLEKDIQNSHAAFEVYAQQAKNLRKDERLLRTGRIALLERKGRIVSEYSALNVAQHRAITQRTAAVLQEINNRSFASFSMDTADKDAQWQEAKELLALGKDL